MPEKQEDISYRIKIIIDNFNENISSFSKKIGVSNNVTIGRIINENRKPSFEILNKILKEYPQINCHWLLTGEGQMMDQLDLRRIANLVSFLNSHNDTLLRNPSFRTYIESNIELLGLEQEKENLDKDIKKVKKNMLKRLNQKKRK